MLWSIRRSSPPISCGSNDANLPPILPRIASPTATNDMPWFRMLSTAGWSADSRRAWADRQHNDAKKSGEVT